jgi:hypothetical protein
MSVIHVSLGKIDRVSKYRFRHCRNDKRRFGRCLTGGLVTKMSDVIREEVYKPQQDSKPQIKTAVLLRSTTTLRWPLHHEP